MAFLKLLRDAAKHFTQHGYTSQADINDWRVRLLTAAEHHLDPEDARRRIGEDAVNAFFKAIGAGRIAKRTAASTSGPSIGWSRSSRTS